MPDNWPVAALFVFLFGGQPADALRRYLPALALGALVWATVYLTIGFAVFDVVAAPITRP